MSFPPNLGITNTFIIDSSCTIFQEFPSLLPHLDHICSPFSKHKMNGYSRINKSTPTNRSKSLDFAEFSLAPSKFNPTPSIPEHGEAFGLLLARRDDQERPVSSMRRSASVTDDGYSRIHGGGGKCSGSSHVKKKKGKLFSAFRRFFRL
ncbi:hypothetical protein SASPL_100155 [Salvia splendens]|uniref:Uncharacterized protein n=1 Tax=Salvia splendens TaxID=180675 RepID=A0A8X8YLV7_SALSN|nr:hypothetical protein SASPL_100155 [Salvia splendens]